MGKLLSLLFAVILFICVFPSPSLAGLNFQTPDAEPLLGTSEVTPADNYEGYEGASCSGNGSFVGGAASARCVCNAGFSGPNCAQSQKDKQGQETSSGSNPQPPVCRGQVQRLASQCSSSHTTATSTCSQGRVSALVSSAHAQKQQYISQGQNNNATCQAMQQAWQNASQQASALIPQCQSAVSSCSSACSQMMQVASSCNDSVARSIASSGATAGSDCSSGGLSQRPAALRQEVASIDQGAQESNACAQTTAAAQRDSTANSGAGPLQQQADYEPESYRPSTQGPMSSASGSIMASPSAASVETTHDESDSANPWNKTNSMGSSTSPQQQNSNYDSTSLASLPTRESNNKEKSEDSSPELVSSKGGFRSGGGGGSASGSSRRAYRLGRSTTGLRDNSETPTTQGLGRGRGSQSETPDLSQFLPSGRQIAGQMDSRGLPNCQRVDPRDRRQCAIHHGPSLNIWSKMKERFENMRQAPAPADYFFTNE